MIANRSLLLVGLASLAVAGVANAHAHLHMSTPANHSTVAVAPKQITLEFNEAVQLTGLTVQKGDSKASDLGPLPATAMKAYTFTLPALDAGNYIVKWRALSDDGHVMADKILFTIGSASAAK